MVAMGSLIDWGRLIVGQRVSMVVHMICRNLQEDLLLYVSQSVDRKAQKVFVQGSLPATTTVALIDVQVTNVCPVSVSVDADATVLPVPQCQASDLTKVVELCSGIGVWSSVAARV